mgnify:CR=1 FL=1
MASAKKKTTKCQYQNLSIYLSANASASVDHHIIEIVWMHPMNVYAISHTQNHHQQNRHTHSSYLMLSMFDNNVFWVELDSWKNNNSMLFGQFLISAFFSRCLQDQNKNGFFFIQFFWMNFFSSFFLLGIYVTSW